MGMSALYGPADDVESIATIKEALDAGITLLDTGDYYGAGAQRAPDPRRAPRGVIASRLLSPPSSASCAHRAARSSASTADPPRSRTRLATPSRGSEATTSTSTGSAGWIRRSRSRRR